MSSAWARTSLAGQPRSARFGVVHTVLLSVVHTVVLSVLTGCAGTPAPRPTLPAASAPRAEREQAYEAVHLEAEGNSFAGYDFTRRDGTYHYDQIAPLLDLTAETRAAADDVTTAVLVTTIPAVVGGGLIGWAVADSLGAQKMSTGMSTAFYVTGGVLFVGALLAAAIWDPVADVDDIYNKALRERLAIEESANLAPSMPPSR